ncbi:PREDICTED: jouberin-like isoform X1 [Polistes dominula]|uniref:Jouberin-like isoform X1 n=1 Tax=Polistes dominula TaxID=743375 RepID=A0ABM1IEM2_POLDO|nr:PREDICTED: jouberin-like isoform X1 [Polistes dominula]
MSDKDKTRLVRNSDWTSDLNASRSGSEIESINQLTLVKRKKPEKKKTTQRFDTNDRKMLLNSKKNDLNDSMTNSMSNESDIKEEMNSTPFLVNRKKVERSNNSKSVDVVVDVHQHYEETIPMKSLKDNVEILDSKLTEVSELEDLSSISNFQEESKKNIKVTSQNNFVTDTIEKFEDNDEETISTSVLSSRSTQNLLEEKPRRRKQWETVRPMTNEVTNLKKSARKRWSKDTSVIRLPETLGSSSPINKNISKTLESSRLLPVPAPRSSSTMKSNSRFTFENEAFISENEEVLRIERDHLKDDTRIEIRRMSDQTDTPSSSQHSKKNFSRKQETTLITENTQDSNVSSSSMKKTSDLSNRRRRRRRRKSSLRSNFSKSIEEISNDRLQYAISENELINDDRQDVLKKQTKITKYSSYESFSTNEEKEEEEKEEESSSKMSIGKTLSENKKKKDRRSKEEFRHLTKEEELKKKKKKKKKIELIKYILITIHKADMLEIDYVTKHPMVKVHIIEAETGNYLKNQNDNGGSSYLQPMITDKFDFKENRSMIPIWEEELIFEHDFKMIMKTGNEKVIIFFEIVDLLSFAEASFNYDRFGNEGCWYKIAWAFLKTVGTNNAIHVDKKLRLQLYRPQKSIRNFGSRRCEVYNWWKSNKREKYPSSLYVTVTSIDPPKLEPVFYQQLSFDDILDTGKESHKLSAQSSELINLPRWTRLAAQSCKIPNEKCFETEISENGCFFLAFNNDGKYLACVFSEEYDYPIVVYEIESTKVHVRFSGHKTFTYSLNWSPDDHYLLSVSSDQTARIWDVRNKIIQHIRMLPHPSYVYCGKFNRKNPSIVATGCYDRVARIWTRDAKSKNYELSQELETHEGFVNSLCFLKNGNLLTGDSVGTIVLWTVKKSRRMSSRKEWYLSKKIKIREIENVIINTIILHPLESRLLVHSRDNGLRMIDLSAGVVLQKYDGLKNQRIQLTACISPCGSLIFCGGEDSTLNVWNLETGKYLARYTIERTFRAVTCVDYHPYDHVLAFSSFGSPAPVRIFKFDKNSTGKDIGLSMTMETETGIGDYRIDLSLNLPNVSVKERSRSMSSGRRQELLNEGELNSFRSVRSRNSTIVNIFQDEENESKYESAKLKLQRLKETEEQLKSRSTSRLYNIIEKIDRILSNTSRSSNDLESGQSCFFKDQDNDRKKLSKKISSVKDYIVDHHSSSYNESSSLSYDDKEKIEMKTFHVLQENYSDFDINGRRSKSAKDSKRNKIIQENTPKAFSDGAQSSKRNRVFRKEMPDDRSDSLNSVIKQEVHESKIISSTSPESAGTYVVEKSEFEQNHDLNSVKTSANERSLNDSEKTFVKMLESDSSLPSNATFTIENEIPIPKPRRNKFVS